MKKNAPPRWMPALGSTLALSLVMLHAGCNARHVVGGIGGQGGGAPTGAGTGGISVLGMGGKAGAAAAGPGGSGPAGGAGGSSSLACAGPVLWGPRRGAYTGSPTASPSLMTLRPTFRWHAPSACAADVFEIQVDDSCVPGQLATCAFASPEVDATVPVSTTRFIPSAALPVQATAPVGAFYAWRVRACAGSGACGAWSEVGYLNVGRVTNDINGDGYADLIASSFDETTSTYGIEIYPGSPTPGTTAPVHVGVPRCSGARFVGDINGDGFGDFVCGVPDVVVDRTITAFNFGGPNLAALTNFVFILDDRGPDGLASSMDAGDFNGDGFSDVVWAARAPATQAQFTFSVYFGAAVFAQKAPDLTTLGPLSEPYQAFDTAANVGDLNGDAFTDFAIFHTAPGTRQTVVLILPGGSSPDLSAETPALFGGDIAALVDPSGDVNGDGYDDLVLNQHGLLPGGPTVPSSFVPLADVGAVFLSGFDINGDGNSDLLISTQPGQIILGGPTPIMREGLNALTETLRNRQATWADYNGDGRTDFALGDSWLDQVWFVLNDGTLDPATTAPLPGPAVSPYTLTGFFALGGH